MSKLFRVVKAYRYEKNMSLREFAAALSEPLEPFNGCISHQTIANWEMPVSASSRKYVLWQLALHSSETSWIRAFALDCLAALYPEELSPIGAIGKRILR